MNVAFDGRKLIIGDTAIELDRPIFSVIELKDRVIVTESWEDIPDGDPALCRNVVAVNHDGKILWRIGHSTYSEMEDESGTIIETPNPWVGGNVTSDGKVRVCDADGMSYELNIDTGEVADGKFVK